MQVIDQLYVYAVKSIHSDKCTCALVKKVVHMCTHI